MKIQWEELREILDKLQIASVHETGKRELQDLLKKLEVKEIKILKNRESVTIKNQQDLQELIDTYDSALKISELF
ncbi:MAG: hypothetical protein AAFN93_14970 [Bacteroidota bacterium]